MDENVKQEYIRAQEEYCKELYSKLGEGFNELNDEERNRLVRGLERLTAGNCQNSSYILSYLLSDPLNFDLDIVKKNFELRRRDCLPETLRIYRKNLGLTQKELSDMIGHPRVDQSTICSFEKGREGKRTKERVMAWLEKQGYELPKYLF